MKTMWAFKLGSKYPVFIQEIKIRKDPFSKSGRYLTQRNATDIPVIAEKAGYKRYYIAEENRWDYVVDNIGNEYWDEDGTKHKITELGEEVPESALLEVPVILLTDEQLAATARAKRDTLLEQFTWRYERYSREVRLGIETTDSIEALDAYAQALADIPQQEGFPTTIEWPLMP